MNHSKTASIAAVRPVIETLDPRQLMSATGVLALDTGGPIDQVVTVGNTVYASTSSASGSGTNQIYSNKGSANTNQLLVDLTASGATISGIDNLVTTADGRVFFTATGGAGGGRQIFQVKPNGGYTQITATADAYYTVVVPVGNQLFAYDSQNLHIERIGTGIVANMAASKLWAGQNKLFFLDGTQNLWQSAGTPQSTVRITTGLSVSPSDAFVAGDYVYFEATVGNDTSLYRADGSTPTQTKIAEDFSLLNGSHVELGDYVYFSGGYYNTSPNAAGLQLYRVKTSDGVVSAATTLGTGNGGGRADGISGIGNNVYFTAGDEDYLSGQGTTDRELFRYDTLTGVTHKITVDETLYPIEVSGGVLSSYYFVAAPTKDDARFGSRALYRTNPVTDQVELVAGVPTVKDSNGKDYQDVSALYTSASGLYFIADTADRGHDTDGFFVATPFSTLDPVRRVLNIEGTAGADVMTMKRVGTQIVVTLNGITETYANTAVDRIEVFLKDGNDVFVSDASVSKPTYVFGDLGDDNLTGGSGNDTLSGGAGKNVMAGMDGDDRLTGSNGRDILDGGLGVDRLYGRGGGDILNGGAGVDRLFGDEETGPFGDDQLSGGSSNDKLYGFGGNDTLIGGNQSDLMFGGDGDDQLIGGLGDDTLDGQAGTDRLFGEDGDDFFYSIDASADFLYGGTGTDTARADATEGVIDLIETML